MTASVTELAHGPSATSLVVCPSLGVPGPQASPPSLPRRQAGLRCRVEPRLGMPARAQGAPCARGKRRAEDLCGAGASPANLSRCARVPRGWETVQVCPVPAALLRTGLGRGVQRVPGAYGCAFPRSRGLGATLEHLTWWEGALSAQTGPSVESICSHTFLFSPPKPLRCGLIPMSVLLREAVPVLGSPGWEATGAPGFL